MRMYFHQIKSLFMNLTGKVKTQQGNEIISMLAVVVIVALTLLPQLLSIPQEVEKFFLQGIVAQYTQPF